MAQQRQTGVVVVGGGIAGLAFALSMHQRGMACDVYESVPQVKELGVGITLLPMPCVNSRRSVCSPSSRRWA